MKWFYIIVSIILAISCVDFIDSCNKINEAIQSATHIPLLEMNNK